MVVAEMVIAFLPKLITSHHGFFKLEDLNLSWKKPREQQLGHCHCHGYQIEEEWVEFQHQ
jgi:hypothetical protein